MSLNGALSISAGGLANVAAGLSVVSQNVANASTPQYAVERATQTSLSAGGQGLGVQSGVVVRATDPALQSEVSAQTAESSAAAETNAALATIEPALGTVAGESDLGSRLTAVQSAFSALLVDPANGTQQSSVVRAAAGLARGINTLSAAYGGARQSAQNGVVAGVAQLNTALSRIGGLDKQIVTQKAQGLSTADLENQRAQAEATVSGLVSARFIDRADGSVAVLTTGGAQLPTDGAQTLLATAATVGPTATYPGGGLPGVTLGGTDITAQLTGGTIGANIALRDNILPTYQGALDEFAQNLASRFSAQGLTLFTDATGAVPTIHAQPGRRPGRLHHADHTGAGLCAGQPGAAWRGAGADRHRGAGAAGHSGGQFRAADHALCRHPGAECCAGGRFRQCVDHRLRRRRRPSVSTGQADIVDRRRHEHGAGADGGVAERVRRECESDQRHPADVPDHAEHGRPMRTHA